MTPKRTGFPGHVVIWEKGEVHTGIWWGKIERKISGGIPSRRWQDDIKMDFKKYGGGVDRFDLAKNRDERRTRANTVMFLKCEKFLTT
jgi:hypothetical protein